MRTTLRQSRPLAILAATLFLFFIRPAAAQEPELDDGRSQELYRLLLGAATPAPVRYQAIIPGSNYAQLWHRGTDGYQALEWLDTYSDSFKAGPIYQLMAKDSRIATRDYFLKDATKFTVTTVVPHPKYVDMVNLGFMADVQRYQPPWIKVSYEEKLRLGEIVGTLYYHVSGECSVLVKLPRLAIANIFVNNCAKAGDLIKLAQTLDFKRLSEKLAS